MANSIKRRITKAMEAEKRKRLLWALDESRKILNGTSNIEHVPQDREGRYAYAVGWLQEAITIYLDVERPR